MNPRSTHMISTIIVALTIVILVNTLARVSAYTAEPEPVHCECCESSKVEAALQDYLSEPKPDSREVEPPQDAGETQLLALGDMTVTIYHAVPEQTDSTPMITASGLDLEGLDLEQVRVCALSRDLLARWGGPIDYGDQIFIDLPDPKLSGWWTVEDTMAKRWTNHIDLLVPTSRRGGKWTGVEALRLQ